MSRILVPVLLLWSVAQNVAPGALSRTFDDDRAGVAPPGFTTAVGRDAPPGRWIVEREGTNQVLSYRPPVGAATPADGFAVAILDGPPQDDVEIAVRLKVTGGAGSAGLVWKYRDELNHYSVQLDLSRQVLEVYRVVSGNRVRVEREDDLELDPAAWYALRIVHEGDRVRAYLGGIPVFVERDRAMRGGGAVGVWVSGAAVAAFDDFRVTPRVRAREDR
jgi:hypothetical protein